MPKQAQRGLTAVILGLALRAAVLAAASPAKATAANQDAVPAFPSEAAAVVVDVVVLDSEGKPLRGLTKADFTLLEDGRPQTIVGFEAVDSEAIDLPADPSLPVAAGGPLLPGRPGRVLVLLVDDLGLGAIRNAADAKKAIAGWIRDQADPRDAVVLVTTSGEISWSGRLVSGRDELLAALDHIKGRKQTEAMSGPEPMSDWEAYQIVTEGQAENGVGGGQLQRVVKRWLALNICAGPPAPPSFCAGQVSARAKDVYEDVRRRGQALLREVSHVAESLEGLRGRKSIFVFSDGALRDTSDDSLEHAVDSAQRANAVVYFINARGLAPHAMYSAQALIPPDPSDLLRTDFEDNVLGAAGTDDLAVETGGSTVRDTNDLLRGLSRVANESSAYYLLGFQPEKSPDGKWRKLSVKVNRPKVTVRARQGYRATSRRPPAADFEGPLVAALEGDAPPHDLEYRIGVLHFAPHGSEREALMLLEVPFSSLRDRPDVDKRRLGILAVVRDDIGRPLARVSQDWAVTMPAGAATASPAPESATFKARLRLAPGRYTLETAVRDPASQRIGTRTVALEIPVATPGLALSSLVLVERGAPAPGDSGEGDPLRTSGVNLTPNLGTPYRERTRELPFLLRAYAAAGHGVALTVELRRGETVLGTVSPEMREPDPQGQVVWTGSIPVERLPSGHYALHVDARQRGLAAQANTAFEIVPAPQAASSPPLVNDPAPVDPRLAAMLDRAGRYVVEYERTFRDLVAEETSIQWAGEPRGTTDSPALRRRSVRSDMVFTTLPGALPWGCFRDVFEVDGQKVRDREARLERLFVNESSASAVEHANAILHEGSRYNIGTARRTANIPTLPLLFLHPENQARFRFEIKGHRRFHDQEGVELHFAETARPTLLKGSGSGLPAAGSFWIAEETGVVLRSDVTYEFPIRRATAWVALNYRPEPGLHIWVPDEMKERYEDLPGTFDPEFGERTEATSRYSNYRRFTVTTNEGVVAVP